jgi:signal transduction histidine kinase
VYSRRLVRWLDREPGALPRARLMRPGGLTLGIEDARLNRRAMYAFGAAGALLAGLTALIALTGDMPHKVGLAERQALTVAAPIAVGLYAWREGTHARFGRLLVLAGSAWSLTALAGSGNELLYSVGRIAGWFVEAGIVYLVLAFPSGRLISRIDRGLAVAAFGLVAVLFLPTALVVETYPSPSQISTCDATCPDNAFMVLGSEPAILDALVVPVREVLAALILIAVVVRLADRIRRATRLMRRTLAPVLVAAMFRMLTLAVAFGIRGAGAGDSAVIASTAAVQVGLPVICLGFLVGLVRWRLHIADRLLGLAQTLSAPRTGTRLRDMIATTLGDPSLDLAVWRQRDGHFGWTGVDGTPMSLPSPSSGRLVTIIRDGNEPVGAVIHDGALSDQLPFVEAVSAFAFVWEDNRQLAARVEKSLGDLRESRARILAAADEERRRIERDLHDGGQQRLVALRIRLELAEQEMLEDPSEARRMLHRLGDDVDATLEELRSLAAGVYPSLLAGLGLYEALRTAALQSPLPVTVAVDGSDRYSHEVETAAYFCCVEAMQNAAKHATGANGVEISLSRNGDLHFEVRDDGRGFAADDVAPGAGLLNMRDRMDAVGGALEVRSTVGSGTTVVGAIPVATP